MDCKNPDNKLDHYFLEFELWLEQNPTGNVDAFIKSFASPIECADELRQLIAVEEKFGRILSQQTRKVGSGERQSVHSTHRLAGQLIGNYRCVQRLGVGGMGSVWLAEQLEPVRRKVAIKLIRPGMDSVTFVKRFKAESQTLAMMSHPNIAKVLEAGAIEGERPYFVMEYVPGVPITDYCNQHKQSIVERLKLFLQVCQAIQHAHQKSILHRDIKPSNILVANIANQPFVKVIDFGLAKILSKGRQSNLSLTHTDTTLGSPLWMSPEQASCREGTDMLDTRSDIYSLGVVLYQLLTNTPPIEADDFRSESSSQIREIINQKIPEYPSTRIARIHGASQNKKWGNHTSSSYSAWSNILKNDLDWITMKAIEKDREQRYSSVGALIDDISRFLAGEPVLARPPSASYRARKIVKKHWAASLATAATILSLIAATTVSIAFANQANLDRELANQDRATAEKSTKVLGDAIYNLFNVGDPNVNFDSRIRNGLADLVADVEQLEFTQHLQSSRADLLLVTGKTLADSSDHKQAKIHFEKAADINEKLYGPNDKRTLIPMTLLAGELVSLDETDQGLMLARKCRTAWNACPDDNVDWKLTTDLVINRALVHQNQPKKAIKNLKTLISKAEVVWSKTHRNYFAATSLLAHAYIKEQRFQEAWELSDECLTPLREYLDPSSIELLQIELHRFQASTSLGQEYDHTGDPDHLLQKAVNNLGANHSATINMRSAYAAILSDRNQHDEAIQLSRENVASCKVAYGEDALRTANTYDRLGHVLRYAQQFDESRKHFEKAKSIFAAKLGHSSHDVLRCDFFLCDMLMNENKFDKALTVADRSISIAENLPNVGTDDVLTLDFRYIKGRCLFGKGQIEKAIKIFDENVQRSERHDGPSSQSTAKRISDFAQALKMSGQYDRAATQFEKSIAIFEQVVSDDHPHLKSDKRMLRYSKLQSQRKVNKANSE